MENQDLPIDEINTLIEKLKEARNISTEEVKILAEKLKGLKIFVYKKPGGSNKFHVGVISDVTQHYLILKRDTDNKPIIIAHDRIDDIVPEREGGGR